MRLCLKECPESAIFVLPSGSDDRVRINWDLCTNCGKCVPVCPTNALYLFGQEMTVDQVLEQVEQDSSFYRESGGGITLSGGECLLQADFAEALQAEAHERGLNTTIETAGNVPWLFIEKVLPYVDTVLHDHKLTDPPRHKKWIGVDSVRIKENYRKAYETFPDKTFIARTPLIPGVNDDEEHIRAILAFIRPYRTSSTTNSSRTIDTARANTGFWAESMKCRTSRRRRRKRCIGSGRSSMRHLAALARPRRRNLWPNRSWISRR
jgi:pyruvate formate lyase activating enzyme